MSLCLCGEAARLGYDRNGNRTSVVRNGVTEWYGTDAADKLQWINTDRPQPPPKKQNKRYSLYRYNDFGQVIERDRRETTGGPRNVLVMEWDGADRLREVKRQGNSVFSATYAPDGERVRKTDSQTGPHLYSHGLHDTFGDTKYTPGMAMRTGPAGKQVDRVFHGDWLGSTRNLTDGTGKKTTSGLRYDGYGAVTAWSGTDGTS